MRRTRRPPVCAALRPAILLCAALLWNMSARAQPSGVDRGENMAWSSIADVVRVTTVAPDGAVGEEGFGFIFGAANGRLFIATADHVVRTVTDDPAHPSRIQVTFATDQGHRNTAELLDLRLPPARGDLAVLQVQRPDDFAAQLPPYADSDALRPGARAWRIGKLSRWVPATAPGEFVGRNGAIWLAFDNLDTPRGSSGGPIVNADGIVGMVVADGGVTGGPSNVLPIGTIRSVVLGWQLPWSLPAAGSMVQLRIRPSFAAPALPITPSTAAPPAVASPAYTQPAQPAAVTNPVNTNSASTRERWTTRSSAACAANFYDWTTSPDLFEFTDQSGMVDVERVISRGPSTATTETISSTRPNASRTIGTRWIYVYEPSGAVRVRNLATGIGFVLTRCFRR